MWQQISSLPLVLEHFPKWDMKFSWWRLNRIPSSGMGNIILQTSNACCHTHYNNFHYLPTHSPNMFLYIPLYNDATSTTPQNHVRMWRLGATYSQTETLCLIWFSWNYTENNQIKQAVNCTHEYTDLPCVTPLIRVRIFHCI